MVDSCLMGFLWETRWILEINRIGVNRDAYGFAVRPQHVQRYREYANIYKVLFYFLFFLLFLSTSTLCLVVENGIWERELKSKKRRKDSRIYVFFFVAVDFLKLKGLAKRSQSLVKLSLFAGIC